MQTLIDYFSDIPSISALLVSVMILGLIFVLIEKLVTKIIFYLRMYYKKKKGQDMEMTEKETMINTINTLATSVEVLSAKVEALSDKMDQINVTSQKRDCAILRDRILQACRFFSKNTDQNGDVHIGIAEYENLQHLFEEYFSAHGNGMLKKIYDEEFAKWVIDK